MLMRIGSILTALNCAALNLSLGAAVSMGARPQAEEPKAVSEESTSSRAREKKMSTPKKIASEAELDASQTTPRSISGLGRRFLSDQEQIWTSPSKIRLSDTQWLVPLSGITAGLLVTDRDFSAHLSHNPKTISHYNTLSNAGVGALIGGAGGMWLLGHVKHNEHWSETGFLAGEAALNSLVVVEGMKYSFGRRRPNEGNGNGQFFQGGVSFPSEHSAAAWSVAGVIAHEYPGPFTKIMAYGLASLVDLSRLRGQQHFPSDVLVGSVIGNLVAQNIYSRHHDPGLGGEAWRSLSQVFRADGNLSPRNMGSPYVPLDSWVYSVFDRLAALGLIDSGFAGMRPWTRLECARLLGEAQNLTEENDAASREAQQLFDTLEREFATEVEQRGGGANRQLHAESVYTKFTGISGKPLTDGYHFGQTILNDFGRPFAEGVNNVTGFSGWASEGRLVAYVRGEYQHAPSSPALPLAARQFIAGVDGPTLPVPPGTPNPTVDHFQLLDAYLAMNFENWQLSYGKQSLWWGPSVGGPLMFSDNATPVTMFRINRVSPFKLPSILGWMGPVRMELFVGQLAGHEFLFDDVVGLVGQSGQPLARQPMIHGEKLSFKPTPNFEFSVSETTVFAGGPTPLNWHNLIKSYTGFIVAVNGAGDIADPRSGIDFTYRIPGLRKWLTLYGDAFTEDELSPLVYPRKSAFQGGIYMPRVPGLPKLDLRVEGGSTSPVDFRDCNGCFYQNTRFLNSYTNLGSLMGTWVGRASQGERAWSTYWLSSRNTIQFQYRHQKVDGHYLPQGGTLNDGGVKVDLQLRPSVTFSGSVQYEKWNYPVLSPEAKSNWTTSVGLIFWPRNWVVQAR
jgi:membrane-associated phospholipid phosphatase